MGVKTGISANPFPPLELSVASAVDAETSGMDSVWFPDHLMGWFPRSVWTPENSSVASLLPSPHLYLDPTVVITAAGAQTERVMIGTGVTDPIRRPPPELARTFLSLSHATKGRAVLGIGAGERENTEAYGLDYKLQVTRLEEALKIVRMLWESDDYVDFSGRFWTLRKAVCDLQPYEGVLPEIWVGAHGPKMLKITGTYGDGWLPSYPMTPEVYASKLDAIRKAAAEAGRDPSAMQAGYQLYVIIGGDHETTHSILESPLARAMSLVATSEQWEQAGRKHPLGDNFEGLRDYVPEWYTPEEIEAAVATYDLSVTHDTVVHGTTEQVIKQLEPLADAGCEHFVFVNAAPLAGLEHLESSRQGLLDVAKALR